MRKDYNYYVAKVKLFLGMAVTAPLFVACVTMLFIWA